MNFRFDAELNPRLDRSRTPCEFRLSPEEVVELDLLDEKRMKEWQQITEKSTGLHKSDNLYVCGAGISTFHIDPYGHLSVCEISRFHNYDLRRGSFQEGWYQAIPEFLAYKPAFDSPCGQCNLTHLCSQCPGWSWLETGNLKAPVEYLCRIAHLRWDVFHRGELR